LNKTEKNKLDTVVRFDWKFVLRSDLSPYLSGVSATDRKTLWYETSLKPANLPLPPACNITLYLVL